MNTSLLNEIDGLNLKSNVPSFRQGDIVRVHTKVTEGTRERIQLFEGMVIQRKNSGVRSTFTVRKISFGVGVEKVFPLHSPRIEKIEVLKTGKVRQGRIYYMRGRTGKQSRLRERELPMSKKERNQLARERKLVAQEAKAEAAEAASSAPQVEQQASSAPEAS